MDKFAFEYKTLNQAYLWFIDHGYDANMDIDNLCLYVTLRNGRLDENTDVLVSPSEVEYRSYLYQSKLENNEN